MATALDQKELTSVYKRIIPSKALTMGISERDLFMKKKNFTSISDSNYKLICQAVADEKIKRISEENSETERDKMTESKLRQSVVSLEPNTELGSEM